MAKSTAKLPETQRAYTLRLRGPIENDHSWRDALWATHEAVNKGTEAFGDWLLTLRGGLCHTLADAKVPQAKKGGKKQPDRDPTAEERRDRRILLALSWLSVESEKGAPDRYVVSHDLDKQSGTRSNWKTVSALKKILKGRGLGESEIQTWVEDCSSSLTAAIRDDAVWVNRSAAFDAARQRIGNSLTHDEVWDLLGPFFGSPEAYLTPLKTAEDSDAPVQDKAKDLVQKAGQWLISRFGTGPGADFAKMQRIYDEIAAWKPTTQTFSTGTEALASLATSLAAFQPTSNDAKGILKLISGPGYKSATRNILKAWETRSLEVTAKDIDKLHLTARDDSLKCRKNVGGKGPRPWSDALLEEVEVVCKFTYLQNGGPARHSEFAVMLDHAARRVSIGHSWIKRAEAERQRFQVDTKKITDVPDNAKVWLDGFCQERSGISGALDAYRIRRRAIQGWEQVVSKWGRTNCTTVEDRIIAAREVQADPDIDKFGDIQLFEALADDDAVCVWQINGEAVTQPLIDYVAAKDAQAKQQRFKVPAYRHPDPLSHPVFCDFGNSRWDIRFAIHQSAKAKTKKPKKNTSGKNDWLKDRHALRMGLWDGQELNDRLTLRWSCKRLTHDLAMRQESRSQEPVDVTRADRLGRAAAGVSAHGAISIAGIFTQAHWSGRLQAPRAQLDAIAAWVEKHGWDSKAKQMRDHLRWLVTFSAKLQPQGPWCEFAAKSGLKTDPKYWPHADENKNRKGHARLILSRFPGLRVLSVDLGHRYAAACAVWETMTIEQMNDACKSAKHASPSETDIYLHLVTTGTNGKTRTTIYRRVGADQIEDIDQTTGEVRQAQHLAPWARLDRQFLIKLQGEDEETREVSNEELWAVHQMEAEVGRAVPLIDRLVKAGWGKAGKQKARLEALRRLGWTPAGGGEASDGEARKPLLSVDEMMSSAVRTIQLGLKRHGRRARIAFNLTTTRKLLPGGREENLTDEGRIELLADTLADGHALFAGKGWTDAWAKQQWEAHIAPLLQGAALPQAPADAAATPKSRKKHRADLTEKLKPVAESLAKNDSLCRKLHCLWATRWRKDDSALRKHLRWLRDWILPRSKKAKADRAIRHVGGLSLTRIATIKSLYQVQKAFYMRPEPDDPRKNVPAKGDDALRDFGRSVLDMMERLREQRVKQLASRIAEAALGVGRMKLDKGKRGRRRPRERVDEPCHAVIIENLTNYRPEETRTRRENRQLMTWSSSKVKKYLSEACQLHGLHLREVQAGYTSRQDSRTGAPGIRCCDVPLADFLAAPWWRKQINTAKEKVKHGKGDARERYLVDLDTKWSAASEIEQETAPPLRIPVRGGELFVSAAPNSPAAKGLQADLNAAANIGLKALLDPDWPGRWWYVPCNTENGKPLPDKVKGAVCIDSGTSLCDPPSDSGTKKTKTKKKEIVNIWRDPSSADMAGDSWKTTPEYWNGIRSRVIDVLQTTYYPKTSAKKIDSTETPW